MPNPYDQFDSSVATAPAAGNPYDQFDQAAQVNPYDQFDRPPSTTPASDAVAAASDQIIDHSTQWNAAQAAMRAGAVAAGLPDTASSRDRLVNAIDRSAAAGYPVQHFIGSPNEPTGDRGVTMDIENLVNSLKQREATDPSVAKERAYWENELKQGMTDAQWRQQTGEPSPQYPAPTGVDAATAYGQRMGGPTTAEVATQMAAQPQWLKNAQDAAAEVMGGFVPKSAQAVAEFLTPVASLPTEAKQLYGAAHKLIAGESLDQVIKQQYPESQQLAQAEQTPPYSKERFAAGFGTVANLLMAHGIATHPDFGVGQPVEAAAPAAAPEAAPPVAGTEGYARVEPTAPEAPAAAEQPPPTVAEPAPPAAAEAPKGIKPLPPQGDVGSSQPEQAAQKANVELSDVMTGVSKEFEPALKLSNGELKTGGNHNELRDQYGSGTPGFVDQQGNFHTLLDVVRVIEQRMGERGPVRQPDRGVQAPSALKQAPEAAREPPQGGEAVAAEPAPAPPAAAEAPDFSHINDVRTLNAEGGRLANQTKTAAEMQAVQKAMKQRAAELQAEAPPRVAELPQGGEAVAPPPEQAPIANLPPAETPGTQPPPVSGINNDRLAQIYGPDAITAGKGRSASAWKQVGQADKRDPYAVLDNARRQGIATPADVANLRTEHQRLLNDARNAYGTPQYDELAKRAVDMANAIKGVAHGPASDVFRALQEQDIPRYESPADFDNIIRERMNRESTPTEKATFQKATGEIQSTNGEAVKAASDAQTKLRQSRPKAAKEPMKFEDAADYIRKQIEELTKECAT